MMKYREWMTQIFTEKIPNWVKYHEEKDVRIVRKVIISMGFSLNEYLHVYLSVPWRSLIFFPLSLFLVCIPRSIVLVISVTQTIAISSPRAWQRQRHWKNSNDICPRHLI